MGGCGYEKSCPGSFSETVTYKMLLLDRDIGWSCRYALTRCELDLTFDLAIMTFNLKILSTPNLAKHKV